MFGGSEYVPFFLASVMMLFGVRIQLGESDAGAVASAYVPLSFDPVEAYQFDWNHEIVILDGVTTTIKVAHVRLYHNRMADLILQRRPDMKLLFTSGYSEEGIRNAEARGRPIGLLSKPYRLQDLAGQVARALED